MNETVSKGPLATAVFVLLFYVVVIGAAASFFDFNLSAFLLVGEDGVNKYPETTDKGDRDD